MNKIIFFVILQCFSFLFIKAQTCVDTSYKKNYISHQNSLINTVNFNIPNTSNSLLAGIIKGLDSALYITKVNNLGNILWAKKLKLNTYSSNRTIINVKVLNNNDIILQARIGDVYGNVTLICLSSIGNFKWVKSLNLNLDLNFDSPSLITDGKSLFVSSAIVDFVGVNSNFNNNAAAIKLDSNANLIFSKRYDQLNCGNVYPTCAINFGDSLIIAGRIEGSGACYNNDDNDEMNFFGFKVDLMNGNLGKSLGYKSPTQFGGATIPFLHYSGNFNNYNNDFYITGTTFKLSSQPNTKNGAYKIRIDSNLNYINGNWYSQNYNGNNIKPRIDFDNNGNTNILFSSNYSISATNVGQVFYTAKIDINNNSIRQKKINNSDLFATSDFAKPFSRKGNYLSKIGRAHV